MVRTVEERIEELKSGCIKVYYEEFPELIKLSGEVYETYNEKINEIILPSNPSSNLNVLAVKNEFKIENLSELHNIKDEFQEKFELHVIPIKEKGRKGLYSFLIAK